MFPRAASPRQLTISRANGALRFDLQHTPVEQIEKLEVQWPSQSLRTNTLIDTPGIASLSSDTSARAGRSSRQRTRRARPTPSST